MSILKKNKKKKKTRVDVLNTGCATKKGMIISKLAPPSPTPTPTNPSVQLRPSYDCRRCSVVIAIVRAPAGAAAAAAAMALLHLPPIRLLLLLLLLLAGTECLPVTAEGAVPGGTPFIPGCAYNCISSAMPTFFTDLNTTCTSPITVPTVGGTTTGGSINITIHGAKDVQARVVSCVSAWCAMDAAEEKGFMDAVQQLCVSSVSATSSSSSSSTTSTTKSTNTSYTPSATPPADSAPGAAQPAADTTAPSASSSSGETRLSKTTISIIAVVVSAASLLAAFLFLRRRRNRRQREEGRGGEIVHKRDSLDEDEEAVEAQGLKISAPTSIRPPQDSSNFEKSHPLIADLPAPPPLEDHPANSPRARATSPISETPQTPQQPETSQPPQQPEVPQAPQLSEAPETPRRPETPQTPQRPETPQTPQLAETPTIAAPSTPKTARMTTPGTEIEVTSQPPLRRSREQRSHRAPSVSGGSIARADSITWRRELEQARERAASRISMLAASTASAGTSSRR